MALGCGSLYSSSTWGEQSVEDSIKAIKTAIDVGINFFDTGEDYGDGFAEELLGSTLNGMRNQVVISTKVRPANLARDLIERTCDNSLKRLKTDYIDLYQIHWVNRMVPVSETIEVMEKLMQRGKLELLEFVIME